jgi:two-component system chemotaxis response regulator CheB
VRFRSLITNPTPGKAFFWASTIGHAPPPHRWNRRRQAEKEQALSQKFELNRPIALTCPDCGGSVQETVEDSLPHYTCHIGHRFTASDMDAGQFHRMETALAVALRTLNERVELCRRMAESSKASGQAFAAERWEKSWREAEDRAQVLRRFVSHDWIVP